VLSRGIFGGGGGSLSGCGGDCIALRDSCCKGVVGLCGNGGAVSGS